MIADMGWIRKIGEQADKQRRRADQIQTKEDKPLKLMTRKSQWTCECKEYSGGYYRSNGGSDRSALICEWSLNIRVTDGLKLRS